MEERYSNPTSSDADFTSLLASSHTPSSYSSTPIPKIAHFIYTSGKQVSWPEWFAIRGAFDNLGVEKVVLWLPIGEEETEGAVWKRVETMKGVEIQRITMPEKVYGHDIPDKYRSDVARLKILWEQGGKIHNFYLAKGWRLRKIKKKKKKKKKKMGNVDERAGVCELLLMWNLCI